MLGRIPRAARTGAFRNGLARTLRARPRPNARQGPAEPPGFRGKHEKNRKNMRPSPRRRSPRQGLAPLPAPSHTFRSPPFPLLPCAVGRRFASTDAVPVTVAYGDGIGPDITASTMAVLEAAGAKIKPEVRSFAFWAALAPSGGAFAPGPANG